MYMCRSYITLNRYDILASTEIWKEKNFEIKSTENFLTAHYTRFVRLKDQKVLKTFYVPSTIVSFRNRHSVFVAVSVGCILWLEICNIIKYISVYKYYMYIITVHL